MKNSIAKVISQELNQIADQIAANAHSVVSVSFVVHDGRIVRVKRGVEIQQNFAAGRDQGGIIGG